MCWCQRTHQHPSLYDDVHCKRAANLHHKKDPHFAQHLQSGFVKQCWVVSDFQCDEEEPRALVRGDIRVVVVVWRSLVDEVEVCCELAPLLSLPFLLADAQDVSRV